MKNIIHTGRGKFGKIYEGINDELAIEFLLENKHGEVKSAMYMDNIGHIDFVYGENGEYGYGIAHIEEKRPGFSIKIPEILRKGEYFKQSKDRILFIYKLPEETRIAVIRLDWNGEDKNWLVTGFSDI